MKKFVGLLCSLVVLLGCLVPVNLASTQENKSSINSNGNSNSNNNNKNNDKLVQVELHSDDGQIIIAQVPKSYEKEYRDKIKNSDFRKNEVQNSVRGSMLRATSYVKYYRKAEVIKMVDYLDNSVNWTLYISNPLTDYLVGIAVNIILKSNFIGTAVAATAWTSADLSNRQTAWWKD